MKKAFLSILLILAAAIPAKWHLEGGIQKKRQELKLGGTAISTELRSKLGQNLAVALLSGFRGIVADFIWLRAHSAWEKEIWYKLKEGIELAVILQPHCISFWDIGSWHMAWNASYGESVNPKYPSDAYRLKAQRDWIEAGRRFLEDGIRNNPDSYDLYFKMGWLIDQKFKDFNAAIPYLLKASTYPEAPTFVVRMVGHEYVKAGRHQEAYEWWKKLWAEDHEKQPQQLWHKIAQWGAEAEEKLGIPAAQRIFPSRHKPATTQPRK
ncbi:MAG: hypothetical protein PHV34_08040 [Verrucomicrobiae bacterium]|nr:hypothetical protein [Verrucomicrobiae bacterium]